MTNADNTRRLRPDVAAELLAEAAYQGRDWAHACRGAADYTAAQAAESLEQERYALHHAIQRRIIDKYPIRMAAADKEALYAAAEAAFLRRMTGED